MLKVIVFVLLVVLCVQAQVANLNFDLEDIDLNDSFLTERDDRKAFEKFKKDYNKLYLDEDEHNLRFKNFKLNLRKIYVMNRFEQGSASYKLNQFADLSSSEFLNLYTGLVVPSDETLFGYSEPIFNKSMKLPTEFDWRLKGAVTEVKDQGMCGSCYAFSAIGNIEGVNKVVNGDLVNLSEEEIIDCDTLSNGCNGGYMINAFQSIIKLGGVETEKDYPYKPFSSKKCNFKKSLARVSIDSYTNLTSNENEIAQYLIEHGPISIGINAKMMQFYTRGIAHPLKIFCNPDSINHGVLLVGFGENRKHKKSLPFWIIKNSWGKKWGRSGYYYVYRGDDTCGLAKMASSAIINKI